MELSIASTTTVTVGGRRVSLCHCLGVTENDSLLHLIDPATGLVEKITLEGRHYAYE